jgi:NDP-sugar pyrophosphorylase family protein
MSGQKPVLVVMAAGIGSRYGGLKQIEPVTDSGEKIIDFSVYDALRAGFDKVIFIIKPDIENTFRETIGDHLEPFIEVCYASQVLEDLPPGCSKPDGRSKPYGTGHAVLAARHLIDRPFAVINADDYYGIMAFQLIYGSLLGQSDADPYDFSMVGYEIGNTLSDYGTVSRGVCQLGQAGYLASITERTKIKRYGGQIVFSEDEGLTWQPVPDPTIVSMNLWGFTPGIISELMASFDLFCQVKLPANPLKAEFYLNAVVDDLVRRGKARVRVLKTSDRWQGITYPADKESLVQALAELRRAGAYPEKLWG